MPTNSYTSNSKGERRYIGIKLIIFVIVLSTLLYFIGSYFEEISKKNEGVTNYKRAWDEFYTLEPNTLDLFFIGSSHSYCTFDPEIMDETVGTNSFNLGSPLQYPDSSYYVLKEALKYHSPEVVVFEIYWDMIDDEFELRQADTVINAIDNKEFERDFTRGAFPLNELVKYRFKPIRYQQDALNFHNNELKERIEENIRPIVNDTEVTTSGVSYHRSRGFIYSDIVIPESEFYETNQFVGFDGAEWEINPRQKSYIQKLVQLSEEEGIDLIFVTAPIANISMEHIENYDIVHNKVTDFTNELNVPYRDYNIVNLEKELFSNENFRDDAHLNYSGVEIFMKDFMEWYHNIHK